MSTSLSKFYRIRNTDLIKLSITIGNGQVGTTYVHLGADQVVAGQKNTFNITLPGTGQELNGKTLYCTTVVADIQTITNETSVTYELTGGVVSFKQTLQETVAGDGDVVFYTAAFDFII